MSIENFKIEFNTEFDIDGSGLGGTRHVKIEAYGMSKMNRLRIIWMLIAKGKFVLEGIYNG